MENFHTIYFFFIEGFPNLSEISIMSIVSNGYVIVSLISVATALITTGFIETLMEIYLENFSLSVENIGSSKGNTNKSLVSNSILNHLQTFI